MPRPVSRGPTPPGFLGQSTKSQNLVYSGPCSLGLNITVADSQLSLQAHGFHLCAFAMLVPCLAFLHLCPNVAVAGTLLMTAWGCWVGYCL